MLQNSLESLNGLLNRMRPILLAAGMPSHQLNIIPKEYKTKTLAFAFDWLHDIYMSIEYMDVKFIWQSLPEHVWVNYSLFEIEDLTEQKLLKNKSINLIKLWKTRRPRLFINRQTEL